MAAAEIYAALVVAVAISFWISVVEATYLTVRRPPLFAMEKSSRAKIALKITAEKTRLVSVTTFIDTVANVVLATTMGILLSEAFGPLGWLISVVVGSLSIMIFLYLVPKAMGIENPVRMAILLAPTTAGTIRVFSPVAGPLSNFAKGVAASIGGKRTYRPEDITEELENVIDMLEADGRVAPDAGKILRSTLTWSQYEVADATTPIEKIVSVDSDATVSEALRVMGGSRHPRIPVFDRARNEYVGALTFRGLSKAMAEGRLDDPASRYMMQAARVEADTQMASVADIMSKSSVTIAFVYDAGRIVGVITLTDILERIFGFRLA